MLSNIKVKAQPNNLHKFPFLGSDVVLNTPANHTTTYTHYGHMRHPHAKRSCIMKEVMEDATGETVSITYMKGSTGSQFDFSCDWGDRLTGTYGIANTEL